ncbi:hypothetical protein TNCV_2814431 [Trichonephila clavipes]|nr:hypothetical protein TNCV_2814431 [Trichonephila clavipes]
MPGSKFVSVPIDQNQTLVAQPAGSSLSGKPHRKNVPEISSLSGFPRGNESDLKNIIIGSKDYEEEFVRPQLSVISEERVERETEEKIARQLRWRNQN